MTSTETNETRPTRLETLARLILGLIFTLSGLNHLLGVVPMPAMTGDTALFWDGLRQTGYFLPLLGAVEAAAGAMLLARRFVPLALVVVAPVALNAAAFHAALAPQALGMMAVVLAALSHLARRRRAAFAAMLAPRAAAAAPGARAVEVLLGLAFVASGVAGLLGRTPPPSTAGAAVMMKGLAASGYFIPALSAVQVAAGALLVARRWVPLTLAVLAPVVVEIVAYRLYVAPAAPFMLVVGAALLAAELWLAFAYRAAYAPLVGGAAGGAAALAASRAALRA